MKRNYIPVDFKCSTFKEIEVIYTELLARKWSSLADFEQWLSDKSELDAVLEENMAWRYIRMTIDTTDQEKTEAYQFFVTEIQPHLAPLENEINQKMMQSEWISELSLRPSYFIYFRSIQTELDIFRVENIPLETEINTLSQEYGAISGQQTIFYEDKELTMPQAARFLKDPKENVREAVFDLIVKRRALDTEKLDRLFTKLVVLRNKVAINSGFTDYRAYKFAALGRFEYSVKDCTDFHRSIEQFIVPIAKKIMQKQADKLGKIKLKPWDSEVDPDGKEALRPFTDGVELLQKSKLVFQRLDPFFGECLEKMDQGGFLDLDSKPGKAPGGYNYPLYESDIPFIFMNAAGSQRDVVTMVHEGGHAVHSFLSAHQPLTAFKNLPSEVAELASMSMELISMDLWDEFYANADDLARAKREQLESIVKVLPWIATIDAFQHWIYTNPFHSESERTKEWLKINERFGTGMVDYSGYEAVKETSWHRQLHLFEVPFYYIEYGIAQLGALGIWMNYIKEPEKAIQDYKAALSLGYTKTIPEIYQEAGLKFDFSEEFVSQLADLLDSKI